jgi:assimilatory nitrate reductase catalytic subunit
LTGQIGKPGAGPLSLTGQPNAMGGREVGALANQLAAHRDLDDAAHRAEMAALWGVPELPALPGKSAVEMFEAAAEGAIKLLWIACTNPAQSMPDQATVRRALERCEFVIVQEAFRTTATCGYADCCARAARGAKRQRHQQRAPPRACAPRCPRAGEAWADWRSGRGGQRLEPLLNRPRCDRRPSGFDFPDAQAAWNEHRESTRGRDLDITGMTHDMLDQQGPQQWPLPSGQAVGRSRLYEDGRFEFDDGRARFAAVKPLALAEPRNVRHPYSLTTGRLRDQWHGMSRTGTVGRLFLRRRTGHRAAPRDLESLNASRVTCCGDLAPRLDHAASATERRDGADAGALRRGAPGVGRCERQRPAAGRRQHADHRRFLSDQQAARVEALCGQADQGRAVVEFVGDGLATAGARARGTRCAARADAAIPVRKLRAVRREPDALGRLGLTWRAAAHEAAPSEVLTRIEALLGLDAAQALRYVDNKRGLRRVIALAGHGEAMRVQAFLLAGQTEAEPWLRALLVDDQPAQAYGRGLLRASAAPPGAVPTQSPQVCTCHNVSEARIRAALASMTGASEARLTQLQQALRCGTECGSCLPALRRLVAEPAIA